MLAFLHPQKPCPHHQLQQLVEADHRHYRVSVSAGALQIQHPDWPPQRVLDDGGGGGRARWNVLRQVVPVDDVLLGAGPVLIATGGGVVPQEVQAASQACDVLGTPPSNAQHTSARLWALWNVQTSGCTLPRPSLPRPPAACNVT